MSGKELIKVFDKISKSYAKEYYGGIEDLNREKTYEEVSKIIKSFKEKNKEIKILEAGCGNGWLTSKLLKFENVKITAVDFSKGMLKELKKRLKQDHKKNYQNIKKRLKTIKQDLLKLTLKQKFDLIILINVLTNVKNNEELFKILKNLRTLLGKKGYFIFSIENKNSFFGLSFLLIKDYKKNPHFTVRAYPLKLLKKYITKLNLKTEKTIGIKIKQNPLKLNLKPKNIIKKTKTILKNKKELKQTINYTIKKILIDLDKTLKINEEYLIITKNQNPFKKKLLKIKNKKIKEIFIIILSILIVFFIVKDINLIIKKFYSENNFVMCLNPEKIFNATEPDNNSVLVWKLKPNFE
jgi:SAM-dependent methyltransferase